MTGRRAIRVLSAVSMAWAAGCESGGGPARQTAGPRPTQPEPALHRATALPRVRYASPNLLPQDTSFELPAGAYVVQRFERTPPGAGGNHSPDPWRRVTTLAVHGRSALRIAPMQSGETYAVYWPRIQVGPDRVYVLSAFLRADDATVSARLVPQWPTRDADQSAHRLARQWMRYEASFQAHRGPAEQRGTTQISPGLVLHAEPGEGAEAHVGHRWVEIDAVQLETGTEPSTYRPNAAIDYAIVPSGVSANGCLPAGDPVALDSAVRNNAAQRVALDVRWHLSEILGPSRSTRAAIIELPQGESQHITLDFGRLPVGYYVLESSVRVGVDVGVTEQLGLAVASASSAVHADVEPFFGLAEADDGVVTGWGRSTTSRPVPKTIGRRLPRLVVWHWRDLETSPGSDDFGVAEQTVRTVLAEDGVPVVCLAGPTPDLAPTWALTHDRHEPGQVDRRQYRQFVFRTVSCFRGQVGYWLLPPVPRQDLLVWSQVFRQAVKLADPNALVVGPGFVPSNRSQAAEIRTFIDEGGAAEIDILIHSLIESMTDPSSDSLDRFDRGLAEVRRACAAVRLGDLPRWELTGTWLADDAGDLAARATRIHRAGLLLKKHGVQRWIISRTCVTAPPGRNAYPIEALACAAFARRLGPARFEREQSISNDVVADVFDSPGGAFAAIFCTGSDSGSDTVRISVEAGLRVENLFGRVLADGASLKSLDVSTAPIYVVPLGQRTNWLSGVAVVPPSKRR